jgi:hypothetical protein
MDVFLTDTFGKSLKRLFMPNIFQRIYDIWYDFKWAIKNLIKYRKIVYKLRPWDYEHILSLMKFQLEQMREQIEIHGREIDEDRLPKVERIKRAIEILQNREDDNYPEKCGYISGATSMKFNKVEGKELYEMVMENNPGFEDYDQSKVYRLAAELEQEEWNELFELLKTDLQGWWD